MTKAPIFEINDSDGKPFKMEDHFPMVLYFYPRTAPPAVLQKRRNSPL